MDTFFKDVNYSLQMFLKSPGFTVTAVAALALGIGSVIGIFSIVNKVLLKPLDVLEPDRIVVLSTTSGSGEGDALSPAKFEHLRLQLSVIQDVSAGLTVVMNYTGGEVMEQWRSLKTSADGFRCFGIQVIQGRTFSSEEDRPNGPLVVVISRDLWKRRFVGDPYILGKTISLNGEPYKVIGIAGAAPSIFDWGLPPEVYVPFQIDPNTPDQGDYLAVLARLRPGVTLEQARARVATSTEEYRSKFPTVLGPRDSFTVKRLREDLVSDARPLLLILLGAVSLVLLIACANVANLLLARAAGRRREIAIRTAVGAGRGRMIRQLLTESMLLSLSGGGMGLLLGYSAIRALLAVNTAALPLVGKTGAGVQIDWRVGSFAVLLSLATGLIFGLFPAIQVSRVDLASLLRDGRARPGCAER